MGNSVLTFSLVNKDRQPVLELDVVDPAPDFLALTSRHSVTTALGVLRQVSRDIDSGRLVVQADPTSLTRAVTHVRIALPDGRLPFHVPASKVVALVTDGVRECGAFGDSIDTSDLATARDRFPNFTARSRGEELATEPLGVEGLIFGLASREPLPPAYRVLGALMRAAHNARGNRLSVAYDSCAPIPSTEWGKFHVGGHAVTVPDLHHAFARVFTGLSEQTIKLMRDHFPQVANGTVSGTKIPKPDQRGVGVTRLPFAEAVKAAPVAAVAASPPTELAAEPSGWEIPDCGGQAVS